MRSCMLRACNTLCTDPTAVFIPLESTFTMHRAPRARGGTLNFNPIIPYESVSTACRESVIRFASTPHLHRVGTASRDAFFIRGSI